MSESSMWLNIGSKLGSGTETTFRVMQKGFKNLAKELQLTAKRLLDMQQVDAANALGHLSMAISRVGVESKKGAGDQKKFIATSKELISVEKNLKNEYKATQSAFTYYMKKVKSGAMTEREASIEIMRVKKSLEALNSDLIRITGSESALNKQINLSKLRQLERRGELVAGTSAFKKLSDVAWSALVTEKKHVDAMKTAYRQQTEYNNELRKSVKETTEYQRALQKLGKATGYQNQKTQQYLPILKQVEKQIFKLTMGQKVLGKDTKWIQNLDRAKIVNAELAGHLRTTANGFKILTKEGLQVFSMSSQTARGMGMLSSSFNSLQNKIISQVSKYKELLASKTEYGKNAAAAIRSAKKEELSYEALQRRLVRLNTEYQTTTKVRAKLQTGITAQVIKYKELIRSKTEYSSQAGEAIRLARKEEMSYDALKRRLERLKKEYNTNVKAQVALSRESGKLAKEQTTLEIAMKKVQISITGQVIKNKELIASKTEWGIKAGEAVRLARKEELSLSALKIRLEKLRKEYQENARSSEKLARAEVKLAEASKKLQTNITGQVTKYRELIKSKTQYAAKATEAIRLARTQNISYDTLKRRLERLKREYIDGTKAVSKFATVFNELRRSFRLYSRYLVASRSIQELMSIFRLSTEGVIDYDQALHDLKAITGATTEQVKRMGAALLDVTRETKFSIGETANAMKKLAQSGFTASEVIAAIPHVANLATGTLETLEATVQLIATAVRVFHMNMSEAEKVADIFANSVNKSRLTINGLNTAFNYIGPLAAAAGVSLKDTTTSMMSLANSGLRFSTIGTGLRRTLTGLLKPTDAFKKAVEKAGYHIDDFNPKLNEFRNIITTLPDVVDGAQEAIKMFGIRGSSVITAFSTLGTEEFNRLRDSLDQVGTTFRMAEEQMKGLQVAMKNIKDRFGEIGVAIGEGGLTSIVRAIIFTFKDFLGVLSEFVNSNAGQVTLQLGLIVSGFVALKVAISAVGWAIHTKVAGMFMSQVLSIAAAIETAIVSFGLLATVLGGLGIAAVVAAITGLVYWMKKADKETKKLIATTKKEIETVEEVVDGYKAYSNAIKTHGLDSKEAAAQYESFESVLKKLPDSFLESAGASKFFTDTLGDGNIVLIKSKENLEAFHKAMNDFTNTEAMKNIIRIGEAAIKPKRISWARPTPHEVDFNTEAKNLKEVGKIWKYVQDRVDEGSLKFSKAAVSIKEHVAMIVSANLDVLTVMKKAELAGESANKVLLGRIAKVFPGMTKSMGAGVFEEMVSRMFAHFQLPKEKIKYAIQEIPNYIEQLLHDHGINIDDSMGISKQLAALDQLLGKIGEDFTVEKGIKNAQKGLIKEHIKNTDNMYILEEGKRTQRVEAGSKKAYEIEREYIKKKLSLHVSSQAYLEKLFGKTDDESVKNMKKILALQKKLFQNSKALSKFDSIAKAEAKAKANEAKIALTNKLAAIEKKHIEEKLALDKKEAHGWDTGEEELLLESAILKERRDAYAEHYVEMMLLESAYVGNYQSNVLQKLTDAEYEYQAAKIASEGAAIERQAADYDLQARLLKSKKEKDLKNLKTANDADLISDQEYYQRKLDVLAQYMREITLVYQAIADLYENDSEKQKEALVKLQEILDKMEAAFEQTLEKIEKTNESFWSKFNKGVEKGLTQVENSLVTLEDAVAGVINRLFDESIDIFFDWIKGAEDTEEAFKEMAASILEDLAKMIMKQALFNMLQGFMGGGGGGGSQMIAVGSGYAPSFHSGGPFEDFTVNGKKMTDKEYLALLEKDEKVLTKNQFDNIIERAQSFDRLKDVTAPPMPVPNLGEETSTTGGSYSVHVPITVKGIGDKITKTLQVEIEKTAIKVMREELR